MNGLRKNWQIRALKIQHKCVPETTSWRTGFVVLSTPEFSVLKISKKKMNQNSEIWENRDSVKRRSVLYRIFFFKPFNVLLDIYFIYSLLVSSSSVTGTYVKCTKK